MSKFAAWFRFTAADSYGIRLQTLDPIGAHQTRQFINLKLNEVFFDIPEGNVEVSTTVDQTGFEADGIRDGSPTTAWSSVGHTSPAHSEHFIIQFDVTTINFLELTPRRVNGKAVGFPEAMVIEYWTGADWRVIKLLRSVAQPKDLADLTSEDSPIVNISLDRNISTTHLRVTALSLRPDDGGIKYFFQIAGARPCYRTSTFCEETARKAASAFPAHLFFLGDEPDKWLTVDEYAWAYAKFVNIIKGTSPYARVSPGGLAGRNNIYGPAGVAYADRFYHSKTSPVDEWRFHSFYGDEPGLRGWRAGVQQAVDWARAHGAPMVLGSFGSPGDPCKPVKDMRPLQRIAMEFISQETSIVEAVWWSFNFKERTHTLVDPSSLALTPDGQLFIDLM